MQCLDIAGKKESGNIQCKFFINLFSKTVFKLAKYKLKSTERLFFTAK